MRIEGNTINDVALETDDTGAVVVYVEQNSGHSECVPQGILIQHNNISNVVDASSRDGRSVCVHGQSTNPGSCRNHTWAVYLDGVSSGVTVEGNVLDATLQGGIYLHQGCNNTVTNNVLVGGQQSQLMVGDFNQVGHTIRRNILQWTASEAAAVSRGNNLLPWVAPLIEVSDDNIYWAPGVDVLNGTGAPTPLFPAGGGGLQQWREATGHDKSSVVADPMFVDAAAGDFRLQLNSPAWALGWQKIPPPPTGGAHAASRRSEGHLMSEGGKGASPGGLFMFAS